MIEAAERAGLIEPGRTTIVEATSGNTGIALALVCAAKGYELVLTLPQGMSRERTSLLRQYGARVEIVESMGGMSEAVDAARELARAADVFLPDQFSNPANPEVHRRTTGPEIARGARRARRRARRRRRHRRHDHRRRRSAARAQPALPDRGGRAGRLGGAQWRPGRPAPHPGHRCRLRAGGAQPRADRRGDRGRRRASAARLARLAAAARGGCSPGSRAAPRSPARSSSAPATEFAGKRIVVILPGLRRALHVAAVLRP